MSDDDDDCLDLEGDFDDFIDDDKDYSYLLGEEDEVVQPSPATKPLVGNIPPDQTTSSQNLKSPWHSKSWASPFTSNKKSNETTDFSFSDIVDAIQMSQGSGAVSDEDKDDAPTLSKTSRQEEGKVNKQHYDRNTLTSSDIPKKSSCMSSSEDKQESLTQEQLRELDKRLFEEMMNNVKTAREPKLTTGDRYSVTIGPVELFDLAQASVQHLIKCQPKLAFFFKRQGKFKKKKGFGYMCFAKLAEAKVFINQVMRVKLSEGRTEISVAAIGSEGKQKVQTSFIFSSANSNSLQKLLTSGADHSKPVPLSSKVSIQIEKIQTEANPPMILLLFPFSSTISFTPTQNSKLKTTEAGYKGPVSVYYLNQKWLDAVLACCSDFKYDGLALKVHQPHLLCDVVKRPAPSLQPHPSSVLGDASDRGRHSSGESNESADDDISNITRNVCAGLRDSLDKLRQMGTDDPNVQKRVLELEAQLTQLEKSLTKKNKPAKIKPPHHDPWKRQNEDAKSSIGGSQSIMEKEQRHEGAKDGHFRHSGKDLLKAKFQGHGKSIPEIEHRVQHDKALEREKAKVGEKRKSSWTEQLKDHSGERGGSSIGQNLEVAQKTTTSEKQHSGILEGQSKAHQLREFGSHDLMGPKTAKFNDWQGKRPSNSAPCKSSQVENALVFDNRWRAKGSKFTHTGPFGANIDGRAQVGGLNPERRHHYEDKISSIQGGNPTGSQPVEVSKSFPEGFVGNPSVTRVSGPPFRQGSSPHISSNVGSGDVISHGEGSKGFEHNQTYDGGKQSEAVTEDDGLHSRLEEFQKELAQKGVVTPEKVHTKRYRSEVSPDRPMHQGAPVYTEKEHHLRSKPNSEKPLPPEFYIQTTFLPNRRCPVVDCPASKLFKTEPMFLDHWDMFHKPTVTMRFCHRCTAYFIHAEELQAHLLKAHIVGDLHIASNMVAEARVKVVANPSFRDPGRFLAPPL